MDLLPGWLLLPVRVLSRLFRRLFTEALERAFTAGRLAFSPPWLSLEGAGCLPALPGPGPPGRMDGLCKAPVRRTRSRSWSMSAAIHTASPFPTIVSLISRMARFTSSWKDYRRGGQRKPMTLDCRLSSSAASSSMSCRSGFQRMRYYGLLGNRYRKDKARPLSRTSRHVEAGAQGR